MANGMNKIGLYFILCFIKTPYTVSAVCTRIPVCEEGQYCAGEECKTCDNGFYQEQLRHKEIACKPWTVRHASENWRIVVNGSSTGDVKWDCMPGYVQRSYSVGETECVPLTTTTASTKASTAHVSSTPIKTSNTTTVANTKEQKLDTIYVVLIICGIVFLIIVIAVLIYHRCKKKLCVQSRDGTENDDGNVPLNSMHYYQTVINNLGVTRANKFIRIIPDPSRMFKAQNRLAFNRHNRAVSCHVITLNDWLECNPTIDSDMYLTWTLNYINHGPSNDAVNANNSAATENHHSSVETNNSTPQLLLPSEGQNHPISTDQCFHKLSYFLVENLGVELGEAFIVRLGEDNLRKKMEIFKNDLRETTVSFVDTLAEWKKSISQQSSIVSKFEEILRGLDRANILESWIYQVLIMEFQASIEGTNT